MDPAGRAGARRAGRALSLALYPLILLGCQATDTALPCAEHYADEDCDGVPDETDRCAGTAPGEAHDAAGCSVRQAGACVASPRFPGEGQEIALDGRDLEFRWDGTCDGYVLYLAPDPSFPAASTVVVPRLTSPAGVLRYDRWKQDLSEWEGRTLYWQVRGGRQGRESVSETRAVVLTRGTGS